MTKAEEARRIAKMKAYRAAEGSRVIRTCAEPIRPVKRTGATVSALRARIRKALMEV